MCAKVAARGTDIYLDHFDLTSFLSETEASFEQALPLVTALGDAGPRRVIGDLDHRASHAGFFDGASGQIDATINALLDNDDHFLAQMFAGPSEGNICYEQIVALESEPISAARGDAMLLAAAFQGRNAAMRATILRNATVTGAGNGTGRNMGATASGTIFAIIYRVVSFTGTNITLTIEHSDDNAAADPYAAVTGLAETLTAVGSARDTVTIVTKAWKRVAVTGTFTSAAIVVTAGTVPA